MLNNITDNYTLTSKKIGHTETDFYNYMKHAPFYGILIENLVEYFYLSMKNINITNHSLIEYSPLR